MSNGLLKICTRCCAQFVCTPQNIAQCQCSAVTLSPAERNYIKLTYKDCLCTPCLLALKAEYNATKNTI